METPNLITPQTKFQAIHQKSICLPLKYAYISYLSKNQEDLMSFNSKKINFIVWSEHKENWVSSHFYPESIATESL